MLANVSVFGQGQRFTVSGNVRDAGDGEDLIGVSIAVVQAKSVGTATNSYGFYSISLPEGKYKLRFSYVGYAVKEIEVDLSTADSKLNVALDADEQQLQEVVVSTQKRNDNVSSPEMGIDRISSATIKKIPVLLGEVDVIKAIQLLPGVQATSEGSSGFSVRGGGYDQNLIQLDEATVYSPSHLMGFFSVFNNDAVKDVTLYKGDIPAAYGGRLSSMIDIRSKDGNSQRFSGTGGVGLIASRLTLEGPVVKDKSSFIVSGRRTYADMFLKMSSDNNMRSTDLYFYDLNAKINYRIDDNNRLFLSGYMGRDNLSTDYIGMGFGNRTVSLRWNHVFSPRLFSNFTLTGSDYNYALGSSAGTSIMQEWKSGMQDYGLKADFSYHLNPRNSIRFGYSATHHTLVPSESGGGGISGQVRLPKTFALEHAAYLSDEMKATDRLTLKYGLRYSLFQNISNGEAVDYLKNYEVESVKSHKRGTVYNYHHSLEPRAGVTYLLNDENSVKAAYSRTVQYIQLASNSAAGSPMDVWFQASQNVKPQLSDQFSTGYFHNFAEDRYEFSAEIYYKNLKDALDFKDHAELFGNKNLERELRFGKGRAYGLELMLRKTTGKLTGWFSYTYANSRRQIDEINGGKWYRSPYDKPHSISIVANYEISRKWSFGANWVYSSGTPVTYPTGKYMIEGSYMPYYSGRNEYRYPAYHRLDLSATVQLSRPESKFRSELNFSLYNAYGRKNPWTVIFRQDNLQPDLTYAEQIYLFTSVPSVTWNFTF
jgi:hypothetical protein